MIFQEKLFQLLLAIGMAAMALFFPSLFPNLPPLVNLAGFLLATLVTCWAVIALLRSWTKQTTSNSGSISRTFKYPDGEAEWAVLVTAGPNMEILSFAVDCYCHKYGHAGVILAGATPRTRAYCSSPGCGRKFHTTGHHHEQTQKLKVVAQGDFRRMINPGIPPLLTGALVTLAVVVTYGIATRLTVHLNYPPEYLPADFSKNITWDFKNDPRACEMLAESRTVFDTGAISQQLDHKLRPLCEPYWKAKREKQQQINKGRKSSASNHSLDRPAAR